MTGYLVKNSEVEKLDKQEVTWNNVTVFGQEVRNTVKALDRRVYDESPINKIITFSNVDGPGNRCAIFFQGCPFQCLYSYNPETIQTCKNCGLCISTCPVHVLSMKKEEVIWDKDIYVDCDICIHICPHLASPKIQ